MAPRSLCSILKTSKSTYKIQNLRSSSSRSTSCSKDEEEEEDEKKQEEEDDDEQQNLKEQETSTDSSRNASLTPLADDTENITGRANSFEYFPGDFLIILCAHKSDIAGASANNSESKIQFLYCSIANKFFKFIIIENMHYYLLKNLFIKKFVF